jgi:hypothetical protein
VAAPMLAMRVRAGVGRPRATAHAEYRRRRATERAAWTHSLPWRIVAVLAVGLAAWLLATQVVPHLAAPAGVTVAAGLAWRLRFRVAPDTLAWRPGRPGNAAPPACSRPSSHAAGRSCTTWPFPAPKPVSTGPRMAGRACSRSVIRRAGAKMTPEWVAWLADRARLRFHAAA